MTHTRKRVKSLKGVNFDIEQKAMTRPKGSAPMSVTANNFRVAIKPSFIAPMTVTNIVDTLPFRKGKFRYYNQNQRASAVL